MSTSASPLLNKKLLLVIDPEAEELAALVRAVALARQNRASLHVLVVLNHLQLDDLPIHPTDRHLMRKCPCPVWMTKGFVTPAQRSARG